jgi:hypothetical protein
MQDAGMNPTTPKLRFFKSTYRVLFALGIISSITLSVRVVIPMVCGVTWQGSISEQITFILLTWLLSSVIIGLCFIVGMIVALSDVLAGKRKEAETSETREQLRLSVVSNAMSHPFPRWAISTAPAFGPPSAMAFMLQFYRVQFYFGNTQKLLLACTLLGAVSFLICLPLTLWSQRTLLDRVKERYPEAPLPPED